MLDLKALPVMRRNMDAFIRADPAMITIQRYPKVKVAGGYRKGALVTLSPQEFRIGWFKRRLYDFQNNTASGNVPVMTYMLIGRWTVDLLRDDEFDFAGDHYRVDSVEPKTNDRTRTDRVVGILEVQVADKLPPV